MNRRLTAAVALLALLAPSCVGRPESTATPRPALGLRATDSTGVLARNAAAAWAQASGVEFHLALASDDDLSGEVASTDAIGFTLHAPSASPLWSTPVAWDALVVIVHPSNPAPDVSAETLRGIFAGRVNSWDELEGAGAAGPMALVVREEGSDARQAFDALALQGLTPSLNSLVAPGPGPMLEAVAGDPAAIGYALVSQLNDSVRAVPVDGIRASPRSLESGGYPLAVPVLAVAGAEPSGAGRAFLLWLQSAEGQALVSQTHGRLRP